MTVVERRVAGRTLLAECEPSRARQAASVLEEFAKLAARGTELGSGTRIAFGWALLQLVDDGSALRVHEIDFASSVPGTLVPSIDASLEVVSAQVALLRRLGVEGQDVRCDQFLVAAPGAVAAVDPFLRRTAGISADDSGWLLGTVDDPEALVRDSRLERVRLGSLVAHRAALLPALALPVDFVVTFAGDAIREVYDADGRRLL